MKSRRELFEEQLKDLQKDISSLSNKLVSPSVSGLNADTKAKSPQSELKSASLTNGSLTLLPMNMNLIQIFEIF